MFSDKDLLQIRERGSAVEVIEQQITNFKNGFPYLSIKKAATVGDGILQLSATQASESQQYYDANRGNKHVVKFVPASGAATRMFKELFAFIDSYDGSEAAYQAFTSKPDGAVFQFFKHIDQFAFYNDLKQAFAAKGQSLEEAHLKREYVAILQALLGNEGLNYGKLPKGLLKFHAYAEGARTPVEEHMHEGAKYCAGDDQVVYLHFTVSPEHKSRFRALVEEKRDAYESTFGVSYRVSYSEQKPATDTIAVDLEDAPFRQADGSILFRPAGHGALLENLNDIEADVVFIKNIDNVEPDRIKEETIPYKKILGGVLLQYQTRIHNYLDALQSVEQINDSLVNEINTFLQQELCTLPPPSFETWPREEQIVYMAAKLNRPIKVCGMVKNEGEPGGGPFWVLSKDGSVSLQIVEAAQINTDDPEQLALHKGLTHFNPVDIVIAVKDHKGNKFNLLDYRDPDTGFITQKSKDGKDLKAQELPGLWNGSMSDWNTLFVEVPLVTFNPVKTVNYLLRPAHQ